MQIENFEDLPLCPEVMKGVEELGFTNLFRIQALAIIPLLEGKDVIGQAQTGTGKTAAFGIPMVERIDPKIRGVQGLVLAPTRELAIQVAERISRFSRYKPLKVLAVYGGESIQNQIRELERGVNIVVGTPGRIIDHLKRRTLNLALTNIVVLDEADRMLDMGFIDDIEYIIRSTPKNKQISLWSATIDANTRTLSKKYIEDPLWIIASEDEITHEAIDQKYMTVAEYEKFDTLQRLIDFLKIDRAILFCRRRITVDRLTSQLKRAGYDAEAIHGQLSQARRESVLKQFREGGR